MRRVFWLAVILKEGQNYLDVIKSYMYDTEKNFEKCVEQKKNFISGVVSGDDFIEDHGGYGFLELKNKNSEGKMHTNHTTEIKNVDWQKTAERHQNLVNELDRLEREKWKVSLDKFFPLTNAIITPDGKWHGLLPTSIVTMDYENDEPIEKYGENYYTKYIKPYEDEGKIIILTCYF